jgi:hypothetical protein
MKRRLYMELRAQATIWSWRWKIRSLFPFQGQHDCHLATVRYKWNAKKYGGARTGDRRSILSLWNKSPLLVTVSLCSYILLLFILSGSAAQRGLWPPRLRGFLISHNDALQSVGLLGTSDQPVAETSTWQHTTPTTDKHPCLRWDSNPDRCRRAAVELRLRQCGHCDRQCSYMLAIFLPNGVFSS